MASELATDKNSNEAQKEKPVKKAPAKRKGKSAEESNEEDISKPLAETDSMEDKEMVVSDDAIDDKKSTKAQALSKSTRFNLRYVHYFL